MQLKKYFQVKNKINRGYKDCVQTKFKIRYQLTTHDSQITQK